MIFENDSNHDSYTETKIVNMWEWSKAESNTTLETDGLGPCIGIVAYDPYTKIGHMAHFPDPKTVDFHRFASSILEDASSIDNLKIWLRGGEIIPEEVEYSREGRVYIEQAVLSLGIDPANLDIAWNNVSGDIVKLSLDCASGDLEETSLNVYDIEGYDEYSEETLYDKFKY